MSDWPGDTAPLPHQAPEDRLGARLAGMVARCPEMPPGMHPVMKTLIGAQYHRCRLAEGHEDLHVNNDGMTWIPTEETA